MVSSARVLLGDCVCVPVRVLTFSLCLSVVWLCWACIFAWLCRLPISVTKNLTQMQWLRLQCWLDFLAREYGACRAVARDPCASSRGAPTTCSSCSLGGCGAWSYPSFAIACVVRRRVCDMHCHQGWPQVGQRSGTP